MPENIDLRDTWFASDLEEYPRETPTHVLSVVSENNINMLTLLHSIPHVQEIPIIEGAPVSEVIERPDFWGVQNTSNLPKVFLLNNHPTC